MCLLDFEAENTIYLLELSNNIAQFQSNKIPFYIAPDNNFLHLNSRTGYPW